MTDKGGFRLKTLKKYRLDMEGVTGSIPVAPTNKNNDLRRFSCRSKTL